MAEDVEEERKFQAERDRFQRQFEVDQSKFKVREVRLGRIFIVKKKYLMESVFVVLGLIFRRKKFVML